MQPEQLHVVASSNYSLCLLPFIVTEEKEKATLFSSSLSSTYFLSDYNLASAPTTSLVVSISFLWPNLMDIFLPLFYPTVI
jgi:hypothetical protein